MREQNADIPVVFLRIAGVYDDFGHSIPINHQIKRIYEKDFKSHLYSGELDHGDVYVHLEDLLDAIGRTVDKRKALPHEIAINIGEPVTPTYRELQERIGRLIHGESWKTYQVPEPIAKVGAYAQNLVSDSFIKPWMIDRTGEHYELDRSRAKEILGWEPKHRLLETLPRIVENLKKDPDSWYEENNLD